MAKFKILAGSHVVSNDPMVTAGVGEIVESELDLVERFGSNKFELVEAASAAKPEAEPKKGDKAK